MGGNNTSLNEQYSYGSGIPDWVNKKSSRCRRACFGGKMEKT